jgi:hypothetical protein
MRSLSNTNEVYIESTAMGIEWDVRVIKPLKIGLT